ncbi:MAG TPA: S-adenosylmethionine:tRNA ribosyltransferase-isomerase [Prolixibacteraceae bacterium]|nr:S-adenosylmethionine:tRNA ribosyltransferase-isomerase [Prolixibacteraceae bacterium]HPR59453.1 S-adenosylmethionine:tRNA ribosyltransferase-isomerase [Prolixibacteraceae bacterium]
MDIPVAIKNISINEYNYNLPDERIAKYPLEKRDASKLLQWHNGSISDHTFSELPNLLPANSKLVFNNTKVIRARLHFKKATGSLIEIFVLDPADPSDYALNFQQTQKCSWKCIVGNLKKWKTDDLHLELSINNTAIILTASNISASGNGRIIEFSWNNPTFTFSEVLEAAGKIPIPPYLHRESETIDLTRYQTVFSKIKGSVAAPTAGLHFTDKVFQALKHKGITSAELTLHVGAGTFQPVKAEKIDGHEMHTEHFIIEKQFIEEILEHKGQIIAVGTTSIRTLESLYYLGVKILNNENINNNEATINQWVGYQNTAKVDKTEALNAVLTYMNSKQISSLNASTQIIIVPGYEFKITDGMLTNFHQPQSTLLLLISAFLGDNWKKVYKHALENNYRFLSYGDSNLYLKS